MPSDQAEETRGANDGKRFPRPFEEQVQGLQIAVARSVVHPTLVSRSPGVCEGAHTQRANLPLKLETDRENRIVDRLSGSVTSFTGVISAAAAVVAARGRRSW